MLVRNMWTGNGVVIDVVNISIVWTQKLAAVKKIRANIKRDAGNADLTSQCAVSANITRGNWNFSG